MISTYLMHNHHHAAVAHHQALADLLDPFTTARLLALGDWSGATCLEVGAGHGGIARWLADQVGPLGQVTATDLHPQRIPQHPQLRVLQHDLTDPVDYRHTLGGGLYDLIHARLTLAHLPERRHILHRLVSLLAADGVLVVEDWAPQRNDVVVAAPSTDAAELYATFQRAVATVFDTAGTDPAWARDMHRAFLAESLTQVDTHVHGAYWTGGGPGAQLIAALVDQLAEPLHAHGLTHRQLSQLRELLAHERLVVRGHLLYATSGHRT